MEFLNENAKRYIRQLQLHRRQSFLEKFPAVHPAAIDLVEKMLTFDPRQRITGEFASLTFRVSMQFKLLVFIVFSFTCSDVNTSRCLVAMFSLTRLEMGPCGALIVNYSFKLTAYLAINGHV